MQASAFSRTSFDHITSASESSTLRGHPGVVERVRRAAPSAPRMRGRGARHVDEQERARVDDHAGLGPVGLDADRAREHRVRGEALAQHREVVEPVEQRQHERGLDVDRARAPRSSPAALVATISASTGSCSRATARGRATKLAEHHAAHAHARRSAIVAAVCSRAIDRSPRRRPGRARRRAARPTPPGPSTATLIAAASSSTPGFITPAGSTAAFAPRSAAANGSGRWRSYQGRWSRPTAWWWVIVAALLRSARPRRPRLIAPHCSISSPRRAGREHREVRRRTVGVDVGEAAEHAARPPHASRSASSRGLHHALVEAPGSAPR